MQQIMIVSIRNHGTNLKPHKLFDSELIGIFTTMNQRQILDKEARNLLGILITSIKSLHQKWAEVRNQVKKLNRVYNNLRKEMKKNQR
jgi:hypothetical protein